MTESNPRSAAPASDEQGRSTVQEEMPPDAGDAAGPDGYDGPGAWGAAAMWLLVGLLVFGTALTVRSFLVTFGG